MIEAKANVNHATPGQGWHALFDANMNGHDEIVRARSVLLHNSKMATIVSLDLFLGATMLLSL